MRASRLIPRWHAYIIHFFTWIALAGFGLSSGTFDDNSSAFGADLNSTATQASSELQSQLGGHFGDASNLVLFVISFGCTAIGVAGMMYYWWKRRTNYLWLTNRIFVPGFSNGLAGAITTISSVFGAQNGHFTTGSICALAASGSLCVICGGLSLVYGGWKTTMMRREHERMVAARKSIKSTSPMSPTAKVAPGSKATGSVTVHKANAATAHKGNAAAAKGKPKPKKQGGWFSRAANMEARADRLEHKAENMEAKAQDLRQDAMGMEAAAIGLEGEAASLQNEADDIRDELSDLEEDPLDMLDDIV
ncbi:hypothetical protein EWM64_g740 [Hericium alpestre]|uniref:Uncharacterized protein n=1 Tax=Hericium alpestre TaxID=135208 RepID=A0A4Z0AAD8_9AGAM|nr:hypothetical protein EWM64_g740 [Hericium alpestre]